MISGNIKNNLQKEIPIFTAMIRDLYEKLDKKFHLNGASFWFSTSPPPSRLK